jgi:SpoVK/Ycf46/Vps4 family AAA+-type ATPase
MTASAWHERLTCRRDWNDLDLPQRALDELREAVGRRSPAGAKSRRTTVSEDDVPGTVLVFVGPDRAQKRIAAEAVARELRIDLFRVDLSAVVSKWIGETGKNLAALFDRAERGRAVLLFDEADALFAKRTEVKDSHDRYANLAAAFLLQTLVARGCIALVTARRTEIDPALESCLSGVIHFPQR